MREYVSARQLGEEHLSASGLTATILRPWYVIGPGQLWPIALVPFYDIARLFPH